MTDNILFAKVARVCIGDHISIEGLRTDCERYAISVQQVAKLFGISPSSTQRSIKRALGTGYVFSRITIKNASTKKPNNCIWLDDFAKYHRHLDLEGNPIARQIGDALVNLSWTQLFSDAFDIKLGKTGRQKQLNRIIDKPFTWDCLFEKAMCVKIQKWYGFDCNRFYWWYAYDWMNQDERARHNEVNPILATTTKTGKTRIARKHKIYQHLDPETRDRLTEYAEYLWRCIEFCDSRAEFEKKWARKYGMPEQLEIFDLFDYEN